MSKELHQYITKLIEQIDGSKDEKSDIYEEIRDHLEISMEEWTQKGYEREEAEQLAMQHFGKSEIIGKQMQEAMFPYRKIMMLILALTSISYSIFIYLLYLFGQGDALIGWLVVSMATSTMLLLFALQAFPALDRKIWVNTTLIVHGFVYLLGYFLATQLNLFIAPLFSLYALFVLVASIFLIYRTAIYDYQYKQDNFAKPYRFLHMYNITIGIFITGFTLFFLWAFLAFSGEFFTGFLFLFIPLFIWIVAYIVQVQLLKRNKRKSVFIIAGLPFIIVILIAIYMYIPVLI